MGVNQEKSTDPYNKIANEYDKYRPTYPDICFDIVKSYLKETKTKSIILDVASGTGIATRKLHQHFSEDGYRIIGLEPSNEMRSLAINHNNNEIEIKFLNGRAENLPFEDNSLSCVQVAQAIWWFKRAKFYKEVNRVLSKNGVFSIIQNNRNWKESEFFDEYESIIENNVKGYNRNYRTFNIKREVLNSNLFRDQLTVYYDRVINIDFGSFVGLSASDSKVQPMINGLGFERYKELLRNTFEKYQNGERIIGLLYTTELLLFRKK